MVAADAHVLDPLDIVHHEMDSLVHSHCVYKPQYEVVSNGRTTRPGEGTCQPIYTMNLQWQYMIKDSQILGQTPSEN